MKKKSFPSAPKAPKSSCSEGPMVGHGMSDEEMMQGHRKMGSAEMHSDVSAAKAMAIVKSKIGKSGKAR